MTTRPSRSTPSSSSSSPHSSKLSKFLAKQSRDRSKSMTDPIATGSTTSIASSSSSNYTSVSSPQLSQNSSRKSRVFGGGNPNSNPRNEKPSSPQPDPGSDQEDLFDETPVIVDQPDMPRSRNRSDRPLSTFSETHPPSSMYASTSSTRISDLPTRLSGWLQHTFTNSSTDLSLPSILVQSQASPKTKSSALLTAAKHGKGHIDRAMRFLLDTDSSPSKSPEPIWLLGVQHPGYEPPPPSTPSRRPSLESRRSPSFRSTTSSSATVLPDLSHSLSSSSKNPANNWPPVFYADFTSRIWLTYRNQFAPIRDSTLSSLESDPACCDPPSVSSSPRLKKWHWPGGGEKGWTSDAGWGCMLRTGQSLLANTLLHLHLGRDWRRPPQPVKTNDYATYVQIITWFLDSPLPQAPFSVHRMALAGKELGKDVGQWFGPSTAAGAIKTLVHAFPEANLGVSVATDGVIYQSDVYAASSVHIGSPRRHMRTTWGGRAVLVLIGIRLGIDGVNPIYYETIKALFTFPQSVGIAGGRPSSSYYFVGSQADTLFYLDPHHVRPAVPLRPAPPHDFKRETTPDSGRARTSHHRAPTSPSSVRTGSSTFSYHAPLSPSPLQHQLSASSGASRSSSSGSNTPGWTNASMHVPMGASELDPREPSTEGASDLDPVADHYATQYSPTELRTFHCDRVRKIPLSGLDPSMLLGFMCKDEADWVDFRKRVNELMHKHKTIFTIQDEPPSWPSDSDEFMGLESISEPDIDLEFDGDGGERENQESEQFFDTRSPDSPVAKGQGLEADTEEDPMGPVTPGLNLRFEVDTPGKGKERIDDFEEINAIEEDEDNDDEDWVDPSLPTPLAPSVHQPYAPPLEKSISTSSASSAGSGGKGKSKKSSGRKPKKSAVPVVKVPVKPEAHFPFPRSLEESVHEEGRRPEAEPHERRMNNARARDGGRTESGGVKAVLTEDMR